MIDRPALALRERLCPAPATLGRAQAGDPESGKRPGIRTLDFSPIVGDAHVTGAGAFGDQWPATEGRLVRDVADERARRAARTLSDR